ncbi:MAG: hypothetical protein RSD57_05365 [Comamonas sp.]
MKWPTTLALLAFAAVVTGCDRPPSSAPAPKAAPDSFMPAPGSPQPGSAAIGPGSTPSTRTAPQNKS